MEDRVEVSPGQPEVPLGERLKQRWLKSWPLAVGALVMSAWMFGPRLFERPETPPAHVSEESDRRGKWEAVRQPPVPDLVWLDLNDEGTRGVAVASTGALLTSTDGGANWRLVEGPPVEAGETPNVAVFAGESIVVGCGTDESRHTTVYEWSDAGVWGKVEGAFGGVAGASSDGSVLVGGGGMVAIRRGVNEWDFAGVEGAEEVTLYGASRAGKQIVVVGDHGFIGVNWFHMRRGPLILEGEPGSGKSKLFERVAAVSGAEMYWIQCYERVGAGEVLYTWNKLAQRWEAARARGEKRDVNWWDKEHLIPGKMAQALLSEAP